MEATHLDLALNRVVDRLCDEFAGIFSRQTVTETVEGVRERLGGYKVTTHIPLLVDRYARDLLHSVGVTQGAIVKDRPEVLFVCVHNAGRSQMAAALLHHHAGDAIVVRSAGSAPADQINPVAVAAMAEVGVDLTTEFPMPLTSEAVQASDVVVTMGCGDACPIFPGRRYEDWELDDPAGQDLSTVRRIRDDIDARVRVLVGELLPRDGSGAAARQTAEA